MEPYRKPNQQEMAMDAIHLTGLEVNVLIGTNAEERTAKQPLQLSISLYGDFRQAGKSDNLNDTFDYAALETAVAEAAENSAFHLLEALAEQLAETAGNFSPRIQKVRIRIDKPEASIRSRCVSVEIER